MCGIVGYIGNKQAVPVILEGLRRLEYRGYDSAGIAVAGNGDGLQVRRAKGKLRNLEEEIRQHPMEGTYGIGHTRWATHGCPTEQNAHPHRDCSGRIVVVHNGIVENYRALKQELISEGHVFRTETDTEVIAHLVERYFLPAGHTPLEEAVRAAVAAISGVFAIAIIAADEPNTIIAARNGPPAVVGLGQNEFLLASDVPAILSHTRDLFFLADGDLAIITSAGVKLTDLRGNSVCRPVQHVSWDSRMAEKGGYRHFMLKEIYEQPRAVRDTFLGHVSPSIDNVPLPDLQISATELASIRKINIAACGTSWHAALAGKFMLEEWAHVPVEVDYSSEWRYRSPVVPANTLTILISQSGETADTIAAEREAHRRRSRCLAICNVVGSAIPRDADAALYTFAGPEIGVASTKAFTTQLEVLWLFTLHLAIVRGVMTREQGFRYLEDVRQFPEKIDRVLANAQQYDDLAREYRRAENFLFLGRGIHYPIALEGALKLKEISYIHAEGYPAGEMKHGPNALIDENLPVVIIATCDPRSGSSRLRYEKTLSNLKEVKARSGKVIAIATEGDTEIGAEADHVIYVAEAQEQLSTILECVPLQLLAYYVAIRRGCDVDQPRNLAKSVTVE